MKVSSGGRDICYPRAIFGVTGLALAQPTVEVAVTALLG
jgi:hypothetical protein